MRPYSATGGIDANFNQKVLTTFWQNLVLQAEPGAGKTTRVPPALLNAEFRRGRQILVLEPRRLAAKYAARWVSQTLGEPVGARVGYQFRFENVSGTKTELLFITEGLLIRKLMSDPELRQVAAVVLDEFHERSLHGDLALAILRRLQQTRRPDLRIVVMSATLDSRKLADYFGPDTLNLEVAGRVFPVEVLYQPGSLVRAVETCLAAQEGDVLVFLPGMAEIRAAENQIREQISHVQTVVLHGELSREEQDLAMQPAKKRKIILSTNIAETSLTIPGVTAVVDTGLSRVANYSWWSGLPALKTRPISKASAIQRAGRAGRQSPGTCVRLYAKGDFDTRPAFDVPEILRADLTQTLLELHHLGISDPLELPWVTPPSSESLAASARLLEQLGALGTSGITPLGVRMAALPVHPRLARLVLEAGHRGFGQAGARLAALISEGELTSGALVSQMSRPLLWNVRRTAERLGDSAKNSRAPTEEELLRSLLTAFPDRVCQRKKTEAGRTEFQLAKGGRLLAPGVDHAEFGLAVDAEEVKKPGWPKALVFARLMYEISADWLLDLPGLADRVSLRWNSSRRAVEKISELTFGELSLSESIDTQFAGPEGARLLAGRLDAAEITETLAVRLNFLAEQGFDRVNLEGAFREWAEKIALEHGLTREEDLRALVSLEAFQKEGLPSSLQRALPQFAPTHVSLSQGRRVAVNYEIGRPPWIESRLQDFFGLTVGPTVGKVPLVLHLLAPNRRAVQVTQDLSSFWKNIYPALRRELGRRYPRHRWPEDPLQG